MRLPDLFSICPRLSISVLLSLLFKTASGAGKSWTGGSRKTRGSWAQGTADGDGTNSSSSKNGWFTCHTWGDGSQLSGGTTLFITGKPCCSPASIKRGKDRKIFISWIGWTLHFCSTVPIPDGLMNGRSTLFQIYTRVFDTSFNLEERA